MGIAQLQPPFLFPEAAEAAEAALSNNFTHGPISCNRITPLVEAYSATVAEGHHPAPLSQEIPRPQPQDIEDSNSSDIWDAIDSAICSRSIDHEDSDNDKSHGDDRDETVDDDDDGFDSADGGGGDGDCEDFF